MARPDSSESWFFVLAGESVVWLDVDLQLLDQLVK